ncbi:MAG: hypothetical protein ACI4D8_06060 [Wujia sp.]
MSKLYNRIMTMGMISMTALLAWVYCLINYRFNLIYIGILSVVLVGSVYALLIAYARLKATKEEILMRFVNDTVNQSLDRLNTSDDNTDIERISKASYVQLRKNNTILSKMYEAQSSHFDSIDQQQLEMHEDLKKLIADSVSKAAKVIVKYSKADSEKQNETIEQLNQKLSLVSEQLEKVTAELNDVKNAINHLELSAPVAIQGSDEITPSASHKAIQEAVVAEQTDNNQVSASKSDNSSNEKENDTLDIFGSIGLDQNDIDSLWDDMKTEDEAPNIDSFFDEFGSKTLEEASAPIADIIPFPTSDGSVADSEPDTAPTVEETVVTEETAVAEQTIVAEEPADPNKMLSPEEIAALFAAASPASETDPEPEPEPVVAEESADPNKMLSPEEIAALFVAASPASETDPEPESEPTPDPIVAEEPADPNKMLSPDEIAALFAAASPASVAEPESEPTPDPVKEEIAEEPIQEEIKEEPVDETPTDPNKMLSPDEIAALFASMGAS